MQIDALIDSNTRVDVIGKYERATESRLQIYICARRESY